MTEYFKIGKIVAVFGLLGDITIAHSLGKKTTFKGLKAIFIEEGKDRFIPYFIEAVKVKTDSECYVKLEQVDDREKAARLLQKEVWLQEADFKKFAAKAAPISLLGYTLIDNGKPLGPIIEVIEQPHQVLCKLMMGKNEALIPIHAGTLIEIDNRTKQVYVQLPDGLLELYGKE